ncbi:hypothetical protein XU18_5128 [Perkinsela sp. CCAP 1560/4]|nr:hypothetical protein XU18_5126 [Perkinsela sp. CCAP 1560/4]KNH01760.1 hypothetical protein XU18_5128 [Perkinsela sp. CCAP 1560/4]|eukprot:KNH01758.1 hypothetical protein XU18_5126 [Perkinsela sp. CCAP 1560/4]
MIYLSRCLRCAGLQRTEFRGTFPTYGTTDGAHQEEKLRNTYEKRQKQILHRLYTQHDIAEEDILDAYMCGTQKQVYPKWVYGLPSKELENVMSAKIIGLEQFDFETHGQLDKLPLKKRIFEWEKVKLARQYERNISKGKWQDGQYSRNFIKNSQQVYHRNLRARYRKMTNFRRELRNLPQRFSAAPTDRIDYSYRFARAARMVQQGYETKGVWPPEKAMREESKG